MRGAPTRGSFVLPINNNVLHVTVYPISTFDRGARRAFDVQFGGSGRWGHGSTGAKAAAWAAGKLRAQSRQS